MLVITACLVLIFVAFVRFMESFICSCVCLFVRTGSTQNYNFVTSAAFTFMKCLLSFVEIVFSAVQFSTMTLSMIDFNALLTEEHPIIDFS